MEAERIDQIDRVVSDRHIQRGLRNAAQRISGNQPGKNGRRNRWPDEWIARDESALLPQGDNHFGAGLTDRVAVQEPAQTRAVVGQCGIGQSQQCERRDQYRLNRSIPHSGTSHLTPPTGLFTIPSVGLTPGIGILGVGSSDPGGNARRTSGPSHGALSTGVPHSGHLPETLPRKS